ncbi:MAG TPA: hypothetical protein VHW09_26780 [Bryobacteraceae bacterium]|jgi:hypothetical protein|nr:hypothetical protein [Bryobacteraceae bacterium]
MKVAINARLVLLALAVLMLSIGSVWAQSVPKTSTNLSGTITTTGTFQQIQGQANGRQGCTITDNTVSDNQWVYFGTCANATQATAVPLYPGQSVNCNLPGGNLVLSDPVCITGTTGDTFFANFQ